MLHAVLNPTECMDQLWMGKGGGMPTPDKPERQNSQPRVLGETPIRKNTLLLIVLLRHITMTS